MIMSNAEANVRRFQLERLILMALQRYERQTGRAIERVDIVGGDICGPDNKGQHILTEVKVVLRV